MERELDVEENEVVKARPDLTLPRPLGNEASPAFNEVATNVFHPLSSAATYPRFTTRSLCFELLSGLDKADAKTTAFTRRPRAFSRAVSRFNVNVASQPPTKRGRKSLITFLANYSRARVTVNKYAR